VLPGLGILVRIEHFWFQDDLCYSTLWSVDSWSVLNTNRVSFLLAF
jgi:hypothetical protein